MWLLQTLKTVKLGCKVSPQAGTASIVLTTSTNTANVGLPQGKKGASASTEGLADQLVAEEAQAAARAASKKQKAKARKLQGQSDALAAALPQADDHAPAEAAEAEDELGDIVTAAPALSEPMLEGDSAAAGLAKHNAAALANPNKAPIHNMVQKMTQVWQM